MAKIITHKQIGNQNIYYTTIGNQRFSLLVNQDKTIDPKSLIPYVNIKTNLEYMDIPKLLIEHDHKDKCRIFNYLIMEYLNDINNN